MTDQRDEGLARRLHRVWALPGITWEEDTLVHQAFLKIAAEAQRWVLERMPHDVLRDVIWTTLDKEGRCTNPSICGYVADAIRALLTERLRA